MLQFTSIAPHLQLAIAEKIEYFDQEQFQLSSKNAKQIIQTTKHLPVVEVSSIYMDRDDIEFPINKLSRRNGLISKDWSQLLPYFTILPRFRVLHVDISEEVSLDSIADLREKARFTDNPISLSLPLTPDPVRIYTELSKGKIFNVSRFNACCETVDPYLIPLLNASELKYVNMYINTIPDRRLSQLNVRHMDLYESLNPRISTTANQLVKEWYEKKRSVEWLRLLQCSIDTSVDVETVLTDLSFATVWRRENVEVLSRLLPRLTYVNHQHHSYDLTDVEYIFSIDREDKKLLVIIGKDVVLATEYIDLEDVVVFDEA